MASNAQPDAPSPETWQNNFERGIALSLHLWADLTFAVENHLGGGDSAAKRDWFAGSVSELFPSIAELPPPSAPAAVLRQAAAAIPSNDDLLTDVEYRLLQIMDEEFDTIVDDGSALEVAEQILVLWRECRQGQTAEVDRLRQKWEASRGKKVSGLFKEGQSEDQDTDWDTEDDDDDENDDDDDDVEMGDAEQSPPKLVSAQKEKAPPEVDEDGFTKVSRKKR